MAEKISAVYMIVNTVTGDFYIGSSKDVKHRWALHKIPYTLNKYQSNPMYHDMKKYGVDSFEFQILEEVEIEQLKEKEQQFIEKLKPTYNNINAKGWDIERYKKYQKEYNKEYRNQLCIYNDEIITLDTLRARFRRAGIVHPTKKAKEYLVL